MKAHTILHKIALGQSSREIVAGVCIVALIVVNVLIARVPLKLDLSRGKAYSLAPASTKILSTLRDPVEITLFANTDLPSRFLPTKTEATDLLTEYKRASTKITVKTLDPKTDKDAAKAASEYGIPPLEFSTVDNDQVSYASGFFGMGIKIKGKTVTIPTIDVATLEYNITSAIYKLTQKTPPMVGIVGGQPDLSGLGQVSESIEAFRRVLSEQFTVEQIEIEKIEKNHRPLIVLDGNQSPVTEENLTKIQAYLRAGGNVILLTDGVMVSTQLTAASGSARVKPLLDEYGISIHPNLVLSAQSEILTFGGGQGGSQYVAQYPYWVRTNVFNPDASYSSNVGSLTFPWVSSLKLSKKSGVDNQEIVQSTPQSWTTTEISDLKPQSIKQPQKSDLKPSLLIASALNKKTKGHLVVIPSSRFVQDQFLGRSGNLDFMINLVNDFASDGRLSGIRSRVIQALPLPALQSSEKDLFKWGNVLLLPLIFIAFGGYRLMKRSRV